MFEFRSRDDLLTPGATMNLYGLCVEGKRGGEFGWWFAAQGGGVVRLLRSDRRGREHLLGILCSRVDGGEMVVVLVVMKLVIRSR